MARMTLVVSPHQAFASPRILIINFGQTLLFQRRYAVSIYIWLMDWTSEWVSEFAIVSDNPCITLRVFTG